MLELESFIDAVSNNSKTPVTGEEGLYALKVAQLCLKSAKESKVLKVK